MFARRLDGSLLTLVSAALLAVALGAPGTLAGQQDAAPTPGALERHHPYLADLLDALERADALLLRALAESDATAAGELDESLYVRLVRDVLAAPGDGSRMESADGESAEASAVPARAREALDRADAFHRALLDVFADPARTGRHAEVRQLVDGYLADSTTALPPDPKEMAITSEGPEPGAFRATHPYLHGLRWARLWLERAAFEPLIRYETPERRRAGVLAVVARFWDMLEAPPETFPTQRPMAPTIAPALVDRHPDAAAILDNTALFRDVVADALAADAVEDPSAVALRMLDRFQDPDFLRWRWYDWNRMAILHGVGNQGGWAIDIIPPPQRTPVEMDHQDHFVIPGMPVEMD